jgi:hypothetical protein
MANGCTPRLQVLTAGLCCSFAEHLVQVGAMQILLGDCGDAWWREDEPEHSMLCVKNDCDERAAVRLLTFLVRHHPRAEGEVVREIIGRLDDVCNMLGAGQRPDQEVGNPTSARGGHMSPCLCQWLCV